MIKPILQTTLMSITVLALLAGCSSSAPPALKNPPNLQYSYKIAPGDTLDVYVRNNPKLSRTIPVRPDGKISMPLVKSMVAADKTARQLADDLEGALKTYIRNPRVTVIVTHFTGTYANQVRVVGQAVRPQAMPYRSGMTLLDVMTAVGGLTRYAAGDRAKLIRTVNGQKKTYDIELESLLNGNISDNVPVRPGDTIIIPKTFF